MSEAIIQRQYILDIQGNQIAVILPIAELEQLEKAMEILKQKEEERSLIHASMETSKNAFSQVWENTEDSVYDKL